MTLSDHQPLAGQRIIGIDIARFVAIVGMMAAHLVAPLGSGTNAGVLDSVAGKLIGATVSSTSATMFAVLGGISLVLLSRSMRDRVPGQMLASILIRGLIISLIGVALDQLHGPISVILTAYGISMIIAAPALLLRSWIVGSIAGILWLFGGAANAQIRTSILVSPIAENNWSTGVFATLRDALLTGHYPAITWVAYMLTGIIVARLLLSTDTIDTLRRICLRLTIYGAGIYAVITVVGRIARMRPSWFGLPDVGDIMLSSGYGAPIGTDLWMLLIPTPHSGTPADMLRTGAGACFFIGLLVLLFDVRRARRGFVLESVRAAGAAPLTIYSAHVVATSLLTSLAAHAIIDGDAVAPVWYALGVGILVLQLTGVIAIGVLLAALKKRGPLEALLGLVSRSNRRVPVA